MELVELLGWVGVGLTLFTYSQKTMLPLRASAMCANLFFIVWSLSTDVLHTLVLHALLLPFNAYRLYEILRMKREARAAARGEGNALDWLKPFVKPMQMADGDYLFRKGDPVDYLYYLDKGTVVFEEVGASVADGNLFGEVAFFTEERVRTASARCQGPCTVMRINEDDVVTLFAQTPAFNVFLMRLLVKRIVRRDVVEAQEA